MNVNRRVGPALVGLLVGVALCAVAGRAPAALDEKALDKVKAATVYIRVEFGHTFAARGSGFVIRADDSGVLIATNNHVVAPPPEPRAKPAGPSSKKRQQRSATAKPPKRKITVVFHSGTVDETSAPARLLYNDPVVDLAFLEVTGVKDPPAPLQFESVPRPRETTNVYLVGFPLGDRLALGKTNPAVALSKAEVHSLRLNEEKEPALIDILDVEIHPGNSGGPLVDEKGRVVGVAVSKFRNTRIGRAVAGDQLVKLLGGQVAEYGFVPRRSKDRTELSVRLRLFDPFNRIKSVTLHYAPPAAWNGKLLAGDRLISTLPGGKKVNLDVRDHTAVGSLSVPASEQKQFSIPFEVVLGKGKTETARMGLKAVALGRRVSAVNAPKVSAKELREVLAQLRSRSVSRVKAAVAKLTDLKPQEFHRREVVRAARPLLREKQPMYRWAAVRVLGHWDGKANLSALGKLASEDDNSAVRHAALTALGRVGDAGAASLVAGRLQSRDRAHAVEVLAEMGPVAEKPVLKVLRDADDHKTRLAACHVLEKVGTEASIEALRKLAAGRSDQTLARAAREALNAITGRP